MRTGPFPLQLVPLLRQDKTEGHSQGRADVSGVIRAIRAAGDIGLSRLQEAGCPHCATLDLPRFSHRSSSSTAWPGREGLWTLLWKTSCPPLPEVKAPLPCHLQVAHIPGPFKLCHFFTFSLPICLRSFGKGKKKKKPLKGNPWVF